MFVSDGQRLGAPSCLEAPVIWQDLRTGGWSFAGSRQRLTDTDADGMDDLVSLHSQSSNPGILVRRLRSTGTRLSTPQIVADLRTGGRSYSASREGVANTYGVVTALQRVAECRRGPACDGRPGPFRARARGQSR